MRMLGWLLACYAVAGALLAIVTLTVGGPLMTRAEALAGAVTARDGTAAQLAAVWLRRLATAGGGRCRRGRLAVATSPRMR